MKSLEVDKVKGYLNISHKAGYLIVGGEKLDNYNKKLYLVIYDNSAQKNTVKVVEKIKEKDIPVLSIDNLEELISIKNCKIIGLKNKNLSDIILGLLKDKE